MKFHQIKMKSHEILYESPLDPFGVSLVSPWCRHVCHVSPRNRRQRLPPGSDSAPSPCVRLTPRSWALSEWASPMVHFMGNIYIYISYTSYKVPWKKPYICDQMVSYMIYFIWYHVYIYIYIYIYIWCPPKKNYHGFLFLLLFTVLLHNIYYILYTMGLIWDICHQQYDLMGMFHGI